MKSLKIVEKRKVEFHINFDRQNSWKFLHSSFIFSCSEDAPPRKPRTSQLFRTIPGARKTLLPFGSTP